MDDELNEEALEKVTGGYQNRESLILREIHQLEKQAEKYPEERAQIIARLEELKEELKNFEKDHKPVI